MLDVEPALLEAVRPFQPMFRFLLDDLSALSLEELAARALHALGRLVQLALWSSRSMERLGVAAPLMAAIAGTLERDSRTRALLLQLYAYLWQAAPPDVAAADMNAAEQLIEQGRAEGEQKGLRAAIISVLGARGLPLSKVGRARLASCADASTLTRWLERAATATSEAAAFASSDAP